MRFVFDTNRLTDLFRGDPDLIVAVQGADEIWLPFIVLGEIRAALQAGNHTAANEAVLTQFLNLPQVGVLFPDYETTNVYARLFQYLRRAGTRIPVTDLWIASLAVQYRLTLLTRDPHFERLPQVSRS